jgi:hypothetical protein
MNRHIEARAIQLTNPNVTEKHKKLRPDVGGQKTCYRYWKYQQPTTNSPPIRSFHNLRICGSVHKAEVSQASTSCSAAMFSENAVFGKLPRQSKLSRLACFRGMATLDESKDDILILMPLLVAMMV